MKVLGLGAAGVGAVTAVTPLFADLDDMMSSGHEQTIKFKRAWYVKERELGNPTTPVDWAAVQGHENNYIMNSNGGPAYAWPADFISETSSKGTAAANSAKAAKSGGFLLRDYALSSGAGNGYTTTPVWNVSSNPAYVSQNLPKYTGSPEENSKMVRAAATFLGAYSVGFAVLEGDEKKFVNKVQSEGRPFVWEDVDVPYDVKTQGSEIGKIVIPNNRTLYAIGIGLEFSKELWRHANGLYGAGQMRGAANGDRYRRWGISISWYARVLKRFGIPCFWLCR